MAPGAALVEAVFAAVAAGVAGWSAVRIAGTARLLRRMKRQATIPLAALRDGESAEVVGSILGAGLRSPFGDRPCVCWQIEVEEWHMRRWMRWRWRRVFERRSDTVFEVGDGSAAVGVVSAGGEVVLRTKFERQALTIRHLSDRDRAVLQGLGLDLDGLGGIGPIRIRERWIPPGQTVYAQGRVKRRGVTLVLSSTLDEPLILSDRSEEDLRWELRRRMIRWFLTGIAPFAMLVLRRAFYG